MTLITKQQERGLPIKRRVQLAVILLVATTVLSALNLSPADAATNQDSAWTTMASMPTVRGGLGTAVVNGKIYAIGGLNQNGTLSVNEEYNPATNHWTTKASMPTPRSGFAITVYNNKIYVIGGTVGNGYVGNNEVYDPATNTWETKTSMPTPRADLSANVVNDEIFLIGGKRYSSIAPYYAETDLNEMYDPKTDKWITKTPVPTGVQGYGSAVLNEKIYVIAGSREPVSQGSTIIVNSNQVYNPKTDSWKNAANLPNVASYGAAASTEDFMATPRIYFVGGFSAGSFSRDCIVYSSGNNSWSPAAKMPTARAYLSVTVVNDALFVIGGFDGVNWLGTNEQFKPSDYGTVPPKIRITSPEYNKSYSEVTLSFIINRGTDWIGYSLDNQENVTVTSETKLERLSQGGNFITVYANDSLGNMGASDPVLFYYDTKGPVIKIINPQNQSYDFTDIPLVFTLDEAASWMAYSLDGVEKVMIIGNLTLPALTDGSHSLTVYATDALGNYAEETVHFSIASFPWIAVAAISALVTIILAASYIVFRLKKQKL